MWPSEGWNFFFSSFLWVAIARTCFAWEKDTIWLVKAKTYSVGTGDSGTALQAPALSVPHACLNTGLCSSAWRAECLDGSRIPPDQRNTESLHAQAFIYLFFIQETFLCSFKTCFLRQCVWRMVSSGLSKSSLVFPQAVSRFLSIIWNIVLVFSPDDFRSSKVEVVS